MAPHRFPLALGAFAVALAASLAACGGGGGGSSPVAGGGGGGGVIPTATPVPTATPIPTVAPQVVGMALPSTAMGSRTDATFGQIGGYTQQQYSQVLGYAPGSQIMIRNSQGDGVTPHTLGVVGTSSFGTGSTLSLSPTGGSTIGSGFNTGTINPGVSAGPFTLATGTFYIGCGYHYATDTMRTVLIVAAGATPGPQATPPVPTQTAPPDGGGGGFY